MQERMPESSERVAYYYCLVDSSWGYSRKLLFMVMGGAYFAHTAKKRWWWWWWWHRLHIYVELRRDDWHCPRKAIDYVGAAAFYRHRRSSMAAKPEAAVRVVLKSFQLDMLKGK
jgi:hypothetical protein